MGQGGVVLVDAVEGVAVDGALRAPGGLLLLLRRAAGGLLLLLRRAAARRSAGQRGVGRRAQLPLPAAHVLPGEGGGGTHAFTLSLPYPGWVITPGVSGRRSRHYPTGSVIPALARSASSRRNLPAKHLSLPHSPPHSTHMHLEEFWNPFRPHIGIRIGVLNL